MPEPYAPNTILQTYKTVTILLEEVTASWLYMEV